MQDLQKPIEDPEKDSNEQNGATKNDQRRTGEAAVEAEGSPENSEEVWMVWSPGRTW